MDAMSQKPRKFLIFGLLIISDLNKVLLKK